MNEKIFLIWNGWGILFTLIITAETVLYSYVNKKFGSGTPVKKWLALVSVIVVPLTFIYSGWILGLLIYPIGKFVLGVSIAILIFRR